MHRFPCYRNRTQDASKETDIEGVPDEARATRSCPSFFVLPPGFCRTDLWNPEGIGSTSWTQCQGGSDVRKQHLFSSDGQQWTLSVVCQGNRKMRDPRVLPKSDTADRYRFVSKSRALRL